jgi:hypothetical protein
VSSGPPLIVYAVVDKCKINGYKDVLGAFFGKPGSFPEKALRVGRIASPLNIGQCLVFLLEAGFDASCGLIRRTRLWYNNPFNS